MPLTQSRRPQPWPPPLMLEDSPTDGSWITTVNQTEQINFHQSWPSTTTNLRQRCHCRHILLFLLAAGYPTNLNQPQPTSTDLNQRKLHQHNWRRLSSASDSPLAAPEAASFLFSSWCASAVRASTWEDLDIVMVNGDLNRQSPINGSVDGWIDG